MNNPIDRRSVLKGLAGILLAGSAPFYVRPTSLMRVKPIVPAIGTRTVEYYGRNGSVLEVVESMGNSLGPLGFGPPGTSYFTWKDHTGEENVVQFGHGFVMTFDEALSEEELWREAMPYLPKKARRGRGQPS